MALAISVTSARVGRGLVIIECNICVATITGFLAATHLRIRTRCRPGDLLLGHFDAQVATGNHNAVGHLQDLVDLVYPFLVLDLRNDLDRALVLVEYLLYIQYVLTVAHERVSDEIDFLLDGV